MYIFKCHKTEFPNERPGPQDISRIFYTLQADIVRRTVASLPGPLRCLDKLPACGPDPLVRLGLDTPTLLHLQPLAPGRPDPLLRPRPYPLTLCRLHPSLSSRLHPLILLHWHPLTSHLLHHQQEDDHHHQQASQLHHGMLEIRESKIFWEDWSIAARRQPTVS